MSSFNTEEVCPACRNDERQAPGFANAHTAEEATIQQGNDNFQGVGLSDINRGFLMERFVERRKQSKNE